MSTEELELINQQFELDGVLRFKEGAGGLVLAEVNNEAASAQIYLHGAQITSFIPNGQEPVLFLSPLSNYEPGKAIRGGIPISWPWFADHSSDSSKPSHGFARTSLWDVRGTKQISKTETQIMLGLVDNKSTREIWDYTFDLELSVIVSKELSVQLVMTNSGDKDFTITSAFHSYYRVGNVSDIAILGLENTKYVDKVDNFTNKTQEDSIRISSETDRIYLDTTNECSLEDSILERRVRISKSGSNSSVVWNPWVEKSHQMKDLGDNGYMHFVCVETTNAGKDIITISPGKQHKLEMRVTVEAL